MLTGKLNPYGGSVVDKTARNRINELDAQKADRTDLQTANARVDNIIAHNNDTEGNTELIDIRSGSDGTTYVSAGSAVRAQIGALKRIFESVTDKVGATSQLLNRNQIYQHLYVNGSLQTSSVATHSVSWTVPVQPGKRYVAYFVDNNECSISASGESGTYFSLYAFSEEPAVSINSTRKIGDIRSDSSTLAFTAAGNESYVILKYRSTNATTYPINVPSEVVKAPETVVKYIGMEQIDSGTNYQNEEYGFIYQLDSEQITNAVLDARIFPENKWVGKKIWWCGTSIPEGRDTAIGSPSNGKSYPELVGELLDADIINVSLGSSMARANTRTGDYNDAYSYNIVRALTATVEEKTDMIQNWSTYRTRLRDPDTYTSLSSMQTTILNSSFENLLLPYLDGTYEIPDVFVFDHGHNDHKYKLANNETDIMLTPDVQNISGGVLTEDTYMTANNNENLESFFGDLSGIPSAELDGFIASVNRNCYIGAMNFLCTLILHYNPRAKIIFIGNLDNWQRTGLTDAQEYLASSWEFPIVKMWEKTGFSRHYIPGSASFWNSENTTDLTMKKIYCKDGTHPHSDTTGETVERYADIIAKEFENIII